MPTAQIQKPVIWKLPSKKKFLSDLVIKQVNLFVFKNMLWLISANWGLKKMLRDRLLGGPILLDININEKLHLQIETWSCLSTNWTSNIVCDPVHRNYGFLTNSGHKATSPLHRLQLYCILLHLTALYCTALQRTTLHYTAEHYTSHTFTALHCTALNCSAVQ